MLNDIINFVSLSEMNKEVVELSAAFNGHIRKYGKCLELVITFQMIYDEFSWLNVGGDFRKYISETVSTEVNKNENAIKIQNALVDGCFDYDIAFGHMFFRMTSSFLDSKISEEVFAYMALLLLPDY